MKNDFFIQIWDAIKNQVLKKTWFIVLCVLLLFIIGWFVYRALLGTPVTIGEIGNEEVWEVYESVIQLEQGNDVVPLESLHSEQIDTALNLFFFMANEGNLNLFTSAIDSAQLEKDFDRFTLGERFTKYEEVMERISRNGTLTTLEVVRTVPHLSKNTRRIILDLYYKDLEKPIRVSVLITSYEQFDVNQTDGDTFDIPYISSSVWDLIEVIESEGEE